MSEQNATPRYMTDELQAACESVLPGAVFPHAYKGPLLTYIAWNYDIIHVVWAEGVPHAARYLVQVHLYLPHGDDPHATIGTLSQALSARGFTWPNPIDAADSEGQHWVLECEYADGGGYYGFT